MEHLEKISGKIRIAPDSAFAHRFPLDFLLFHRLRQRGAVLPASGQGCRHALFGNRAAVLRELVVQGEDCHTGSRKPVANRGDFGGEFVGRCLYRNHPLVFQIPSVII